MHVKKRDLEVVLITLGVVVLGIGLLGEASEAAQGARQGLTACSQVIIPTIFPFLALSILVITTPVEKILAKPIGLLSRIFYGAPQALAPAVFLSWIGGYPAGAKVLAQQLKIGAVTKEDAQLAMNFCVNSGPAFMAGVVGLGVFGSVKVGLQLFGCQLLAGVITGWVMRRGRRFSKLASSNKATSLEMPFAAALVHAVAEAASSMIVICAFVIFFSTIGGILRGWGVLQQGAAALSGMSMGFLSHQGAEGFLLGLLEICGGSALAIALPPNQAALVLPFLLSFGSLSVLCQLMACFSQGQVGFGRLLRGRIIHGLLTTALASPWLWQKARLTAAFAPVHARIDNGTTTAGTICMLGMCIILFLTIEGQSGRGGS